MTLLIQTRHLHHVVAATRLHTGRAVHRGNDSLGKRGLDRGDGGVEGLRDAVDRGKGRIHIDGHVPRRRVTVAAHIGTGTHSNSSRILIQIAVHNGISHGGY